MCDPFYNYVMILYARSLCIRLYYRVTSFAYGQKLQDRWNDNILIRVYVTIHCLGFRTIIGDWIYCTAGEWCDAYEWPAPDSSNVIFSGTRFSRSKWTTCTPSWRSAFAADPTPRPLEFFVLVSRDPAGSPVTARVRWPQFFFLSHSYRRRPSSTPSRLRSCFWKRVWPIERRVRPAAYYNNVQAMTGNRTVRENVRSPPASALRPAPPPRHRADGQNTHADRCRYRELSSERPARRRDAEIRSRLRDRKTKAVAGGGRDGLSYTASF